MLCMWCVSALEICRTSRQMNRVWLWCKSIGECLHLSCVCRWRMDVTSAFMFATSERIGFGRYLLWWIYRRTCGCCTRTKIYRSVLQLKFLDEYYNWNLSSNWLILWEIGTDIRKLLTSAALQMQMVSLGSGHCQISQKTVVTRKSQSCALYLCGVRHKICFLTKLNHFVPKDDNNHCGSVMLRKLWSV